MDARSYATSAADTSSVASPVASPPPPPSRPRFSLPLRFTIGQLMILTAIVGLAMAPLAMILKNDRIEWIVAMAAFDLIGLPAVLTVVLLTTMKPGPARLRTIVVLSLLPTLVLATAVGVYYLAGFPFFLRTVAREFADGNFRHLPVLANLVLHPLWIVPTYSRVDAPCAIGGGFAR